LIVYAITNVVNGKRYIGMTMSKLGRRWTEHKNAAKSGVKTALYEAIRKYGADSFTIEALVTVSEGGRAVLAGLERRLIAEHGTLAPGGYNMTLGGDGLPAGEGNPNLGRKATAEHKAKVAATWTPEKRAKYAAMTKERSAAMNAIPGRGEKIAKAWTPERRAAASKLMREISKNAWENEPPEAREKRLANLALGRKASAIARRKDEVLQ
jgi:group I intron endonuclease